MDFFLQKRKKLVVYLAEIMKMNKDIGSRQPDTAVVALSILVVVESLVVEGLEAQLLTFRLGASTLRGELTANR